MKHKHQIKENQDNFDLLSSKIKIKEMNPKAENKIYKNKLIIILPPITSIAYNVRISLLYIHYQNIHEHK